MVDIPRLRQHVWTNGPADGRALLLLHGNTTTGGFWRYIAERLPVDVRVIAPDHRYFGLTEPKPVDATAGCATWPTTCTSCSRRSGSSST
jgi:pimeloyl-ACP methyl ester carboxylesterase